jgi:spermidine/putrescine transport system substrate-binding protein
MGGEGLRVLAPSPAARLDRRRFLGLAARGAAALGLGLTGCTGSEADGDGEVATPGAAPVAAPDQSAGTLRMYSWEEYTNPENLDAFTARSGTAVEVDVYESNEEAIAALERGAAYDLVVPSNAYIPQLIAGDLLRPLDLERIPNVANVDPSFRGQPWDPEDAYTVVKAWGSSGFLYDTTIVTEVLTSWADFFRVAALPGMSGRVSVLGDRSVVDMAMWREGFDWQTDAEAELDRVEAVLTAELLPHLTAVDSYPVPGLLEERYALSQAFSGDARTVVLEFPERYRWVLPAPHTELWVDHWAIPATAEHPEAAHALIDHMLAPNVSARELSHHGYATAVQGVEEFLPFDLPAGEMIFLAPEQLSRMLSYTVPATEERRNQMVAALQAGVEAKG